MAKKVRVRPYPRVSSDEQKMSGYSLPAQREQLEAYVARFTDWAIADWYVDDGYSAKNLARPAMKRLLNDLQPGDAVVVYKLDRLTRNVADLQFLVDEFERRDISLHSVQEHIDTSTASGRFFMRLIIEVAQWERETLSERTIFGKEKKAGLGEWNGGPPPIGYIAVPSGKLKAGKPVKKLEPDPDRQHLVPMIFEKYLAGYGVRAICIWLNDDLGVRTTSGAKFQSSAISRLLVNPTYCGFIRYGGRGKSKHEKISQGEHTPLVTREMFEKVQEVFASRKESSPRQATGRYPFTGIAECGVCGGNISVLSYKRNGLAYYSYRCAEYVHGKGCGETPLISASGKIVEENFVAAVEKYRRPENVDTLVAQFAGEVGQSKQALTADVNRLKADLNEAETAINQWKRLFEKERISDDEYFAEVEPHKERKAAIEAKITELESTCIDEPDWSSLSIAAELFREAWNGYENEPESRKPFVQSFLSAYRFRLLIYSNRAVALVPTVERDSHAVEPFL